MKKIVLASLILVGIASCSPGGNHGVLPVTHDETQEPAEHAEAVHEEHESELAADESLAKPAHEGDVKPVVKDTVSHVETKDSVK